MHPRRLHRPDGCGGEQLHAVERSAGQMETEVVHHVGGRHVDAACRRGSDRTKRKPAALIIDHGIGSCGIGRSLQFLNREANLMHSQWRQDTLAREILPRLAGNLFSNHASGHIAEILVLIGLADIAARLEELHCCQHLLCRPIAGHPDPVVTWQPAAVTQQVDNRDPLGGNRVVQAKLREVFSHRLMPVEPAFIRQHGQPCRGEGLGDRAEDKLSVHRHGQASCHVALTEPLEEDGCIVLHDGNRETGNLPLGHRLADQRVRDHPASLRFRSGSRAQDDR